jgi:hypothetical protein
MNLPTLIFIAILIPFTIVAILWIFAQAMGWFMPRPRARGVLFVALGLGYVVWAIWDGALPSHASSFDIAIRFVGGVAAIGLGVAEYRQGAAIATTPDDARKE